MWYPARLRNVAMERPGLPAKITVLGWVLAGVVLGVVGKALWGRRG